MWEVLNLFQFMVVDVVIDPDRQCMFSKSERNTGNASRYTSLSR